MRSVVGVAKGFCSNEGLGIVACRGIGNNVMVLGLQQSTVMGMV